MLITTTKQKKVAWALLISCRFRCSKPLGASIANAHTTNCAGRLAYTLGYTFLLLNV